MRCWRIWRSGVTNTDWRGSGLLTGLQERLVKQDSLTAVLRALYPDVVIISARIQGSCLHVLVPSDIWTLPLKDLFNQQLADLSSRLSTPLDSVKIRRCMAEQL